MKKQILLKIQLILFISIILVCSKTNQERLLDNFGVINNKQRRVLQGDALNVCDQDHPGNCESCEENYCLKCKDHFVFPKCEDCQTGYFKSNNQCQSCTNNCLICSSIDKCQQCKLNFTLTQDGKCTGNSGDKNYYFAEYEIKQNMIILNFSEDIEIKERRQYQSQLSKNNCNDKLIIKYGEIECFKDKSSFRFFIKLCNIIQDGFYQQKYYYQKNKPFFEYQNIFNNLQNKYIKLKFQQKSHSNHQFICILYKMIFYIFQIIVGNQIIPKENVPTDDLISNIKTKSSPELQLKLAINYIICDFNSIGKLIEIDSQSRKISSSSFLVHLFLDYEQFFNPTRIKIYIIHMNKKINFNNYFVNYVENNLQKYYRLIFKQMEKYCENFQIQIDYELINQTKTSNILNVNCDFEDNTIKIDNQTDQNSNFNPQNEFQLPIQIKDLLQSPLNDFDFEWKCIDKFYQSCQDRNGKQLIMGNKQILTIQKETLNFNSKFQFIVIVSRNPEKYLHQQYKYQLDTGYTELILSDESRDKFETYDFYDVITVQLDYNSSLHQQYEQLQFSVILTFNDREEIIVLDKRLEYNLSEELVDIDLTQTIEIKTNFKVYDPILQYPFYIDKPLIYKPKTYFEGCQLQIQEYQNNGLIFNNVVSMSIINCKNDEQKYEFFYYENEEDKNMENNNPQINRKKILSLLSKNSQVQSVFLPGNPIIYGVIQNSKQKKYNLAQNVSVKETIYSESQFEKYIQIVYGISQNNQPIEQELLIFSKIIQQSQQYIKQQEITEISNKNINNYLNLIFQRLNFHLQSKKSEGLLIELQNQSQSLVKILSNSFIDEINAKTEEDLKTMFIDLEKNIQNLNESQKSEYKIHQTSLITEYMNNLYILNEFDTSQSLKYIELNTNVLKGISKIMQITKEPFIIETQTVKLGIDKLSYHDLMAKYFVSSNSNTTLQQLNQTNVALLQIWPYAFPLFRDEITNSQLEKKINQNQDSRNISLKHYPLIQIDIFKEDSLQQQTPEIISSPIQINFGHALKRKCMQGSNKLQDLEQKRLCLQRQINGLWTSDHCKYKTKLIENQVEMVCECSKIGLTTIVDDIKDLFDDDTVKEVFKDNIFGILLDNWYEYALIWTVFGLNIFLIISILIGVKMDKNDKQSEFQVKQTNKFLKLNEIAQEDIAQYDVQKINDQLKKSLFISIKNTKVSRFNTIYQQTLDTQNSQKPQQTNILQKQNTNIEIDISKNNLISNDLIKQGSYQKYIRTSKVPNNTLIFTQNENQKTEDFQKQYKKLEHDIEQNVCIFDITQQRSKLNKYHTQSDKYVLLTCNDIQLEEVQHAEIQNQELITNDKLETLTQLNTYVKLLTLDQFNTNNEIEKRDEQDKHTEILTPEIKENNKDTEIKSISQIEMNQMKSVVERNRIQSISTLQQKSRKQKEQEKEQRRQAKMQLLLNTKQKMETYLQLENKYKAIFLFHNLFSIYLISLRELSRAIRFIIYYYKLIWLLAITSIFGKNRNLTQIIALSLISWIVLDIFTKIVKLLFIKKKLRVFSYFFTFAFLVLCYYCIFQVMYKQDYKEANNWIGTYMLTFFINEFIIDTIKSSIYYFIFRKFLKHMNNNFLIKIVSQVFLFKSFLK